MSTAAKVAADKAKRPEQYCPQARCLWRTGGGFCPRHERHDWRDDYGRAAYGAAMHAELEQGLSDGELGPHEGLSRLTRD